MSIFNDHCAALSTKSSHQDSSNRIAWSRNGSCRKEGIFFAHLTDMNRSLAAVSNVQSLEGTPLLNGVSVGLSGGERGVLVNGRASLCGVSWPFSSALVVLELTGEDMSALGLLSKQII